MRVASGAGRTPVGVSLPSEVSDVAPGGGVWAKTAWPTLGSGTKIAARIKATGNRILFIMSYT
jgi:hypothetical protein